MNFWLIDPTVWEQMEAAREAGSVPTAKQMEEFAQAHARSDDAPPKALAVSDGVAKIDIRGALTKSPDMFAMIFGGGNTTYRDIQQAVRTAENDPDVKKVVFEFDTPGGRIDGLFETIDAIRAMKKPKSARASLAASAGFALAAVAGPIEAMSRASQFGSVGIMSSHVVRSNVVNVTSTDAPKKRPDATTEEGRAMIREHLDEIHSLFADAIAGGRGVSTQTVNDTYGRGGVLLAASALERGMIDSIAGPDLRVIGAETAEASAESTETKQMKWSEFKAAHPEEAAKAIAEGVEQERQRTVAHLKMGEACGDLGIALGAIRDGKSFDVETQSAYMAASLNRDDRQARSADEQTVEQATSGAAGGQTPTRDLGDELADAVGAPALEA